MKIRDSKNPSSTSGKRKEKESKTDKALKGIENFIRLLPTGTIFFFRSQNPLFTHNGDCHTVNKVFTGILIVVCSFSCFFSAFIDSFVGSDGLVHYGIATIDGFWPSPASDWSVDLKKYKIILGDFVVALCTLIMFAVVSLLDPNTLQCYYPSFESTQHLWVMLLPPVVAFLVTAVFIYFGTKRHGFGYPSSPTTTQDSC
ncbi:hypothetical protein NE237_012975 [Protea cynaroides]|uniref:Uncharacterized protein n=1 Tax=Protea cynaroides TaxID=273540 RepID=A0A9Q0JYJ8_9MAGN|nr:hypothetical protein NE237_012975 [Protea cynaroides]